MRIKPVWRGNCNEFLAVFERLRLRLALGYSKTLENHRDTMALFVCADNVCRVHSTTGGTPAPALKLATETWTIEKLIEEVAN